MAYLPPKRIFLLDQTALTNNHEYNTGFQKGDKASTMTSKDTWLHPRYTWSVESKQLKTFYRRQTLNIRVLMETSVNSKVARIDQCWRTSDPVTNTVEDQPFGDYHLLKTNSLEETNDHRHRIIVTGSASVVD